MVPPAPGCEVTCSACESRRLVPCRVVNGYEIVACQACGLRFVPPARLAQVDYDTLYSDQGEFEMYRREAKALAAGEPYRMVRARRLALDAITRQRARTLLDVGCGVGGFLKQVEKLGIQAWGLDPSARAIGLARGYLKAELHCGVLDAGAFPGRTFDVISAWEVLEHVSDCAGVVRSIHGRLNPGGRMYLSTPNGRSTWVWDDIEDDPRSRPPVHVAFWSAPSLERFLERMGFESVHVSQVSVHFSASVWSRGRAARARVVIDSVLRPAQRRTLYAVATRKRN